MVKGYIPLSTYDRSEDKCIVTVRIKKFIPFTKEIVNPDYAFYVCNLIDSPVIIKIYDVTNKKQVDRHNETWAINTRLNRNYYLDNKLKTFKTFKAAYAYIKYKSCFPGWSSDYNLDGSLKHKQFFPGKWPYNGLGPTKTVNFDRLKNIIIVRNYVKNYTLIKTLDDNRDLIKRYQGIFYDYGSLWELRNYKNRKQNGKATFHRTHRTHRTDIFFYKNGQVYGKCFDYDGFRLVSRTGLVSKQVISLIQRIESVAIKKNVKNIY
jgi:hypothetical protein